MQPRSRSTWLLLTALSLAVYSSFTTAALTLPTQSVTIMPISSGTTVLDTVLDSSSATGTDTQSLSFLRFNTSTGVLTGAAWGFSSLSGTMTLTADGTSQTTNIAKFLGTAEMSVSNDVVGPFSGTINSNSILCSSKSTCFGVSGQGNPGRPFQTTLTPKSDTSWFNPSKTETGAANLDNYVGTGALQTTLTMTRKATLSSSGTSGVDNPSIGVNFSNLTGSQTLQYTYLKHADASFAAGNDTNQIIAQLTELPLSFSVFNLGDTNTTKLDKVSVNCVGDCDAFQLTLPSIQDLIAGGSGIAGSVTRIGNGAGSATYTLMFSDDTAIGASSSRLQNSLSVNVAAVPEPAEWAMLIAGLLVVVFISHRRKTTFA